jgi:hypothetical protein
MSRRVERRARHIRTGTKARLAVVSLIAVVAVSACSDQSHRQCDPATTADQPCDPLLIEDQSQGESRTSLGDGAPPTTTSGHGDSTEIDPIDPLPLVPPSGSVEFAWQRASIATPADIDVFIQLITPTDDGYLAFGSGYGAQGGAGLLVWESTDGLDWSRIGTFGVPDGFENPRIAAVLDGYVAQGETFGDTDNDGSTVFLHSLDGSSWIDVTPEIEVLENEHVYFHEDLAVGAAGALAIGSIEFYAPEPPLEIEYEGMTIVIDHERDTLEIFDSTGAIRYTGSSHEVFDQGGETEEGIRVFHPETRDQILLLSWDVIATIDERFTDIDHGAEPEDIVVEVDAYTLEIRGYEPGNPEGAEFEIRETASGATVAEGTLPELSEGPPPRFVADDGTVVLEFPSWEAWWDAEHAAYEEFDEGFEEQFRSRPLALVSTNGVDWRQADLGGGIASNQEANLWQSFAGPDGFVVRGSVNNRDTQRSTSVEWRSPDGESWQVTPVPDVERFLWGVTRTSKGFLGVAGEGEGGAGIMYSEEGIDWEPVLVVAGEPGTYTFVQSFAVGEFAAVAAITTEGPFDDHGIHDEPHGDEVEDVPATVAGEAPPPTTEAPAAVTTVVSHGDGLHEDETFAVIEFSPPETVLYVTFDGRTFFEMVDDGTFDGLWISNIQVVGDRVFVVAQESSAEHGDIEEGDGGERFEAPPIVVFVGTRLG